MGDLVIDDGGELIDLDVKVVFFFWCEMEDVFVDLVFKVVVIGIEVVVDVCLCEGVEMRVELVVEKKCEVGIEEMIVGCEEEFGCWFFELVIFDICCVVEVGLYVIIE